MPFKGRNKALLPRKETCLTAPSHRASCRTPFLFMWLIPEGTIWECPICTRNYYLNKHLTDTGGDRFSKWINLDRI